MNGPDLRIALSQLVVSQTELAALLDVSVRTVGTWVASDAPIPGPVEAYVHLLTSLPRPLQLVELRRVREGPKMEGSGLYGIEYSGIAGLGSAMIVAMNGRLFGSDGGASYDGAYVQRGDQLELSIVLTVPAGVPLVTGMPAQATPYSFAINTTITAGRTSTVMVDAPMGKVQATVKYLRPIPALAA